MTNGEMSPFVIVIYLVPRRQRRRGNQTTDDDISSSVDSVHIITASTSTLRPQPTD
ncbi:uncharacterized protein LACBIDRAFT_318439 [Laccaria bicolor S238N-H82]|uniref:Predicted protein n=1 Tax=Laccaria bicolor (strain S238N-H82 / ATCC MYA-4686) TaxID=486041 RepID=B0DI48_LACBS|nr:uncharacterized protein LACBIDRAFT_302680 [Laccaria bicolor S238N-H82]XP_001890392.1 uncharacterized protein LACBIDRAFT_318439 [Laccaria bicolor S238N-H82]EDQ98959.1 predicted protein [Laccaria bicolor S238N-H82]EDR05940.1 predicted protein [Laccaria bicolor S238N-H82]|eukprot:XP_001883616.1 predicted protein [Laccaria bicolor S238N-H82]